jgi:hypothetical protein
MKYLITCLIAAALVGCEQAADTTAKQPEPTDTATSEAAEQAAPEEVKDPSGRIFEFGVYKPVRKGRMRDELTAGTGKVINQPVLELAERTDRIPLVKGTYFAYRYRLLNFPKEEAKKPAIKLRKVLVHPEMKLPDGGTSTGHDRQYKGRTSVGQVTGFDGYAFNEDYELVEGDWIFQIWYQDQMLVEQKFTMYWPEEGAEAGAAAEAEQSDAGQQGEEPGTEPAVESSI